MNWQSKEDEIKRTIDSYEFDYVEGDWEVAKAMLLNRKRQRRLLRWSAAVLLIIVSVTTAYLYQGQQKTLTKSGVDVHQNSVTAPNNGSQNAASQNNPSASANTLEESANNSLNNTATTITNNTKTKSITAKTNKNNREKQTIITEKTEESTTLKGDDNSSLSTQNNTKDDESAVNDEQQQSPNNILQNVVAESTLQTTEEEITPPQTDEVVTTNKEDDKKEQKTPAKQPKQVRIKNALALVVGGNYNKNKSNNIINSPYFGVQYSYHLNTRWTLGGGLGYTVLNTSGFQKDFTGTKHSFGVTQTQISITTNRLQYIEMPLFAKYNYKSRFNFMGGVNLGYLLNTNNTIKQTTFTTLTGIEQTNSQTATTYKRGLSPIDLQLQLGAETAISNRLWLGAWLNGGLFDVGRDRYYNNRVFERNMRLQLYIRYDVFKF